jgi:hypothetical protein
MKKLLVTVVAVGVAIVSMLPGMAAAKLAGNHNQTLLRARNLLVAIVAVGFALTAMLPGAAAARLAGNHNQTRLTD